MKLIASKSNGLKGQRADVAAGNVYNMLSRSYISRLFDEGRITVNGHNEKPGYRLREGDSIESDFKPAELDKIPDIELPIIYEDENVIVVNKPAGVISHSRGKFWDEPSVASFIRQKIKGLEGERAGIVHRLDRATSGVMICAKNAKTLSFLQKQFSTRSVVKTYLAIVEGTPKQATGLIDAPIARNLKKPTTFVVSKLGKPAQTKFKVLKTNGDRSLMEFTPLTGRTHQLRVHAKFLGHPIVGDAFYGKAKEGERLLLHANKLTIKTPSGQQKTFEADLPKEFKL